VLLFSVERVHFIVLYKYVSTCFYAQFMLSAIKRKCCEKALSLTNATLTSTIINYTSDGSRNNLALAQLTLIRK